MLKFSEIHKQVLNTLKSNTFSSLTDSEIEESLDMLLIRAVADFRFPNVSLAYEQTSDEGSSETYYVFTEDITQNEINVLLSLMKLYWLEQQLDSENRFEDLYYDRDVKTYSRANMMKTLNDRYKDAQLDVRTAQYNYSRVKDNKPTLGDIYE